MVYLYDGSFNSEADGIFNINVIIKKGCLNKSVGKHLFYFAII